MEGPQKQVFQGSKVEAADPGIGVGQAIYTLSWCYFPHRTYPYLKLLFCQFIGHPPPECKFLKDSLTDLVSY